MTLHVAFLVLALVCFLLAATGLPRGWGGAGWLGLAFVVIDVLLSHSGLG